MEGISSLYFGEVEIPSISFSHDKVIPYIIMNIESSDFIAQESDNAAQWSRETKYFLLTRHQVGGRLLLRKSLKPQYLTDSHLREILRKEYEIGSIVGMESDYVVSYYQMVDTIDECYLTMDFVEGATLAELALADPGFLGRSRNIERLLLQLLEGLRTIHRCQVVHLDLKPGNIMVTRVSRDIRIIDLGFCYADSYQTSMGMTDSFASPEQLDGSGDVDARSDIYAIGRILQYLERELKVHCQWRKKRSYIKLISRCLSVQKSERWQNVDEMIQFVLKSKANKMMVIKIATFIVGFCTLSLLYILFQRPAIGYDEHTLYGKFSLFNRTCLAVGKISNDLVDPRWQGNLYVSSEVKHWGLSFKVIGIEDYAFIQDTSFITINLPASLTRIGAYSFKECTKLIAVNIPDQVEDIGSAAFWGDSCLKEIKLPTSLKTIPEACFHLCAFSSLTIPEGISNIEIDAFAVCRNLREIYLPQSLSRLGRGVFWRCESLEKISLPRDLISIGEYTFMGCAKLRQIENHAPDPQSVISLFDDSISGLCLSVPFESIDKYKQSPEWNRLMITPLSVQ